MTIIKGVKFGKLPLVLKFHSSSENAHTVEKVSVKFETKYLIGCLLILAKSSHIQSLSDF